MMMMAMLVESGVVVDAAFTKFSPCQRHHHCIPPNFSIHGSRVFIHSERNSEQSTLQENIRQFIMF